MEFNSGFKGLKTENIPSVDWVSASCEIPLPLGCRNPLRTSWSSVGSFILLSRFSTCWRRLRSQLVWNDPPSDLVSPEYSPNPASVLAPNTLKLHAATYNIQHTTLAAWGNDFVSSTPTALWKPKQLPRLVPGIGLQWLNVKHRKAF